jgi:hypothetical protein
MFTDSFVSCWQEHFETRPTPPLLTPSPISTPQRLTDPLLGFRLRPGDTALVSNINMATVAYSEKHRIPPISAGCTQLSPVHSSGRPLPSHSSGSSESDYPKLGFRRLPLSHRTDGILPEMLLVAQTFIRLSYFLRNPSLHCHFCNSSTFDHILSQISVVHTHTRARFLSSS